MQECGKNIALLAPALWNTCPEEPRYRLGIVLEGYNSNLYKDKYELGEQFFALVGGNAYRSPSERVIIVDTLISELLDRHNGWDNFHHEAPVAANLWSYVRISKRANRPKAVRIKRERAQHSLPFFGRHDSRDSRLMTDQAHRIGRKSASQDLDPEAGHIRCVSARIMVNHSHGEYVRGWSTPTPSKATYVGAANRLLSHREATHGVGRHSPAILVKGRGCFREATVISKESESTALRCFGTWRRNITSQSQPKCLMQRR